MEPDDNRQQEQDERRQQECPVTGKPCEAPRSHPCHTKPADSYIGSYLVATFPHFGCYEDAKIRYADFRKLREEDIMDRLEIGAHYNAKFYSKLKERK